MSKLRPQLDAARREYEALRYPGDLAGQMLPSRPRRRRRWLLAAAAAIVALTVLVPRIDNGPDDTVDELVVQTPPPPADMSLPALSELMPDVSLAGMLSIAAAPFEMLSMDNIPGANMDLDNMDLSLPFLDDDNAL